MKMNRNLIIGSIFLICILLSNIVSADPTVDSVESVPESPKPLSTFTILATITGDNIISVKVSISECTYGDETTNPLCYVPHVNIPMTLNDDGKYECEVTLTGTQKLIDHVQYQFDINDDGADYTVEDFVTDLDVQAGNGNTNGGGDNGSPGFELVFVLVAIMIGVLLYKKKR